METFNFPYHVYETIYPESSVKIQFGRGYEFATDPDGPDQVRYMLHFQLMKFFLNSDGTINRTIYPDLNMAKLIDFYETHRLSKKFLYKHPVYGQKVVRFSQPLRYKGLEKGSGAVEPFTLEFTLQP